jgi:hypothetical protein
MAAACEGTLGVVDDRLCSASTASNIAHTGSE